MPTRHWVRRIAAPVALGLLAGAIAGAFPWVRHLLGFAMVISGLAWVLRGASDWFAERAGPQRGTVLLGSILLGAWLVLAISPPEPLRRLGFGPIRFSAPERDPYAIPPAGSKTLLQSLDDLRKSSSTTLATPEPGEPEPPAPESPPEPTDARRVAATATLQVSSGTSVTGEGIVLIGSVRGDGRPLRGVLEFVVDDQVVAKLPLRVQGESSQAEFRLVGLKPGLYAIRAVYAGGRSFEPSQSERVLHRVVER